MPGEPLDEPADTPVATYLVGVADGQIWQNRRGRPTRQSIEPWHAPADPCGSIPDLSSVRPRYEGPVSTCLLFEGHTVSWRLYSVVVGLAVLALSSGCATQPRTGGVEMEDEAFDISGPSTLIAGARVDDVRSVAMGAARSKGWEIVKASDQKVVMRRPVSPDAPQAVEAGLGPGSPASIEVTSLFRQAPGGVSVALNAQLVTQVQGKGGDGRGEQRTDYTESYRDNLTRSLDSLRSTWAAHHQRVARALPPLNAAGQAAAETAAEMKGGQAVAAADLGAAPRQSPLLPQGSPTAWGSAPVAEPVVENPAPLPTAAPIAVAAAAASTPQRPAAPKAQTPGTTATTTASTGTSPAASTVKTQPTAAQKAQTGAAPKAQPSAPAKPQPKTQTTAAQVAQSTTPSKAQATPPAGAQAKGQTAAQKGQTAPLAKGQSPAPTGSATKAQAAAKPAAPAPTSARTQPPKSRPPAATPVSAADNMLTLNRSPQTRSEISNAERYAAARRCKVQSGRTTVFKRDGASEYLRVYCAGDPAFVVKCTSGVCKGLE